MSYADATLVQLRGLAWTSLSDTGTVGSLTVTDDSGGGAVGSFAAGTAIPCRLDPVGGGENEVADRLEDRTTHLITVPVTAVVTTKDRVVISGRGTYEVTAVRSRTDPTLDLKQLEAVPTT